MQTTSIKVTGIYPPDAGKKKARVRVDNGEYYYVWPDQLDKLAQGNSYEIDFTSDDFKGKTYKTIKAIRASGGGGNFPASDDMNAASAPAISKTYKPWPGASAPAQKNPANPHKDEMIFVMNQAAAAINAGQVIVGSPEYIPFINKLRSAYGATFGSDEEAA